MLVPRNDKTGQTYFIIFETARRICTPVATAFGGSSLLSSGDMRLSFGAVFGTICSGVAYGTCKNEKIGGDAEAAAREGGDETADDEVRREEGR